MLKRILAIFLTMSFGASCHMPSEDSLHSMLSENAAHLKLAFGSPDITARINDNSKRYRWPFIPTGLGHSMASYQNYGNDPYFHHGLDIVGKTGQVVEASVGGRVVDVRNYRNGPLYWEVAILDQEGYIWQYHHIDRDSIPQAIHNAFRQGESIPAGTTIGSIVRWPHLMVSEAYHHIHLNVLAKGGVYVNPFAFLEPLGDQSAPVINDVGILQGNQRLSGNLASGSYSIYAEISDVILGSKFSVPPYKVDLMVNGIRHNVWTFNNLPGEGSRRDFINELYVTGNQETCGNYNCRRHVFNLGFRKGGESPLPKTNGEHTIEVVAADFVGNSTKRSFTYRVEGMQQLPPGSETSQLWLAVTEVGQQTLGFISAPKKVASVRICSDTAENCRNNHHNLASARVLASRGASRNIFDGLDVAIGQQPRDYILLGLDQEGNIISQRQVRVTRN